MFSNPARCMDRNFTNHLTSRVMGCYFALINSYKFPIFWLFSLHFFEIAWGGGRYFWPGPEYFLRVLLANGKKMKKATTTPFTWWLVPLYFWYFPIFSHYTTPRGTNTAITWITHTYHGTKGWSKSWFLIKYHYIDVSNSKIKIWLHLSTLRNCK